MSLLPKIKETCVFTETYMLFLSMYRMCSKGKNMMYHFENYSIHYVCVNVHEVEHMYFFYL